VKLSKSPGNASLTISDLKRRDSGLYVCEVGVGFKRMRGYIIFIVKKTGIAQTSFHCSYCIG